MGREIRFVHKNWVHPKGDNGSEIPLFDGDDYMEALSEWDNDVKERGLQGAIEWNDGPPDKRDYMTTWSDNKKTHMMMYEDTSEGTPVSPIFPKKDKRKLAKWLVDNNASYFGDEGASFNHWLSVIDGGFGGVIFTIKDN